MPLLDAIRWESSQVMEKKTWWKAFFAAGEDVMGVLMQIGDERLTAFSKEFEKHF